LGARPRISDPISFAVALVVAFALQAAGVCGPPWCGGGVIDTAGATTAVIGTILGLGWRGLVRLRGGGRPPGGGRRKRRGRKRPTLTVVASAPDPEARSERDLRRAPPEPGSTCAIEPANPRIGAEPIGRPSDHGRPAILPTMWPEWPAEVSEVKDAVGRPSDAD